MSDFVNITRNNNDIISTYAANQDSEGEVGEAGLAIQLAQIASKKIYAKDHGVKLDGVTDDTAALNNFFQLFGTGVELIVDNGVALVTGQLNLPGMWGSSTNNGVRKLTFDNATINYQGLSGKACVQIYNHQKSVIRGLSILKSSKPTYVNFVGFWYSKFTDFEVPQICFNKNTTDITASLSTSDSYTSVFERGVTYSDSDFYGIGTTGGGSINSMTFNDVKWQGNQVTPNAPYNLAFYGTGYENFNFNYCDFSYATNAVLYIDVAQTKMALNFYGGYFDSNLPLITSMDYKGAKISLITPREGSQSSNQLTMVKAVNVLSSHRLGSLGNEADNIPKGTLNLIKNGDILLPITSTWLYSSGSPTYSITSNANAINGNSLTITYNATSQTVGANAMTLPFTGVYTTAVRLKKTGQGIVQLGWNGIYITYDLSPYADGEELIISNNARGATITQGTNTSSTLSCIGLTSTTLVCEVLEWILVQGTHIAINIPVHPQANFTRVVPLTNAASISNNGSFAVSGRNRTRIDNGSTSVTGIIINPGGFDNQEFTIINESSSATITFAASGSNVADGSSDVINAGTARKFVWNAGKSLWYRLQ